MSWKSRLFYLSAIACLSGSLPNEAFAHDDKPAKTGAVGSKRARVETDENQHSQMTLDEISKEFTTNIRAYSKRYRAAPTARKKREVARTIPKVDVYQKRLIALINAKPGSEAGLDVVEWWYRRGGRSRSADTIVRLIVENYSTLKSIEKYVPYIAWYLPKDEAEKNLRSLLDVNSFDVVKASATYQLHELLRKQAAELEGEDAEALNDKVKTLKAAIYNQYAEARDTSGANYVELIEALEFAARLEVGKPVPDVVGSDTHGVDFKLSDYDGKVRVISFWGHW